MAVEEGDAPPAIHGLVRPISVARVVEECVPGAIVAVEFVILAKALEHRLGAIDLIGGGIAGRRCKIPSSGQFSFSVAINRHNRTLAGEIFRIISTMTLPPSSRLTSSTPGSVAGGEIGLTT